MHYSDQITTLKSLNDNNRILSITVTCS